MYLAFIAAKEINNNRSLKGKKQSIRNSFSSVLQPFEMLYKSCVLFHFVKNHSELKESCLWSDDYNFFVNRVKGSAIRSEVF